MKPQYKAYIDENYFSFEQCYGACLAASKRMNEVFPELRVVCGYVGTPWGLRNHWWLVDPEGNIVDPTARQFPAIFDYKQ